MTSLQDLLTSEHREVVGIRTFREWFEGEAEAFCLILSMCLGFLNSSHLQQTENGHIEGKELSGKFDMASSARTHGSF